MAINNKNTRSVQQVNNEGVRVLIPTDMAKELNIHKGDIIHFEISENKCLILKKL
jgi:antitoxin component of MazEF toxin-antitoxin module